MANRHWHRRRGASFVTRMNVLLVFQTIKTFWLHMMHNAPWNWRIDMNLYTVFVWLSFICATCVFQILNVSHERRDNIELVSEWCMFLTGRPDWPVLRPHLGSWGERAYHRNRKCNWWYISESAAVGFCQSCQISRRRAAHYASVRVNLQPVKSERT